MNYYVDVLKNYANFNGRARRTEYWMFVLFNAIIGITLSVLSNFVSAISILYIIYSFAVLVPGIAVTTRRLHDIGKSGWMQLFILIPIVGGILLLVWTCTEGTHGDNLYGADPKGSTFAQGASDN